MRLHPCLLCWEGHFLNRELTKGQADWSGLQRSRLCLQSQTQVVKPGLMRCWGPSPGPPHTDPQNTTNHSIFPSLRESKYICGLVYLHACPRACIKFTGPPNWLSLSTMSPRDLTQVIRPGRKCLSALSHLAGPQTWIFSLCYSIYILTPYFPTYHQLKASVYFIKQ